MTDGDIERCKKFRHFTIGNAIFYLVVIAAYVAMLNAAFIEELIDVSISSIWLGFLLLNDKMLTISPAILVAVYGTILGLTAYRFLVFIPAVTRARAARASKLGSALDFKRLRAAHQRPRGGIPRSCTALYLKVIVNFGHFMDLLSTNAKKLRAFRERKDNEMWTSMNRIQSDGILGPMSSILPRPSAPTRVIHFVNSTAQKNDCKQYLKRRNAFRLTTLAAYPEVYIPPMILAMRGTGVTFVSNGENYVADQVIAKKFFNCADESPPSRTHETPTVCSVTARRVGSRAKSYRSNKGITSDPHEALRRLLSRHFLGPAAAERGDEISAFDEPEALRCTFYLSELKSYLNFIFDIYYPNNNILTEDERAEVFEYFHSWWQSARLKTVPSRGHIMEEQVCDRDRVLFSAFSSWFLLVSETLVVAHTMRTGPVTI